MSTTAPDGPPAAARQLEYACRRLGLCPDRFLQALGLTPERLREAAAVERAFTKFNDVQQAVLTGVLSQRQRRWLESVKPDGGGPAAAVPMGGDDDGA
jgi:hypothetical protein